jgi:predicted phage terminase large subunit-like protein
MNAPLGAAARREVMRAQPGPQTRLLSSAAQIVIYGGQAGGGKTFGLLLDPLHDAIHWSGFRGVLLRKTLKAIAAQGGPWDVAQSIYPRLGATSRGFPHFEWTFPSGAKLSFAQIHDDGDLDAHQGSQYTWLGWDEGTHFSAKQFWFMVGRLRSPFGEPPPGTMLRCRLTCNPDPRSFVAKLIGWWVDPKTGFPIPERDGVIRYIARDGDKAIEGASPREVRQQAPHLFFDALGKPLHWSHVCLSLTFIKSTLADNHALMAADPGYQARLRNLDPVTRRQWMDGNWLTVSSGEYFMGPWFPRLLSAPQCTRVVRFWDLAGSKRRRSDFLAGVKMGLMEDGRCIVLDVVNLKGNPAEHEQTIRETAVGDGAGVEIWIEEEKGASGQLLIDNWSRGLLRGFEVRGSQNGNEDKVQRAKLPSAAASKGHILLLERAWVDDTVGQLEAFPEGDHDDIVDGVTGAWHRLCGDSELAFASVSTG